MTVGEKIKVARQGAGLTQVQLAEKLNVSRQAITKWESDKGLPDVENLKRIAKLLNVSVDYLLDDGESIDKSVIREQINLENYGKGRKKVVKDKVVRDKFPDYDIYTLLPKQKETKGEKIVDNLIGFLTEAPFGIPDFLNSIKLLGTEYYLVVNNQRQFLVLVSDEFIESRELVQKFPTNRNSKFEIGDLKFINCGPIVYE